MLMTDMTTHFLLVFPFSAELCGLLNEHFDDYLVQKFYSNTVHIRNPGTTLLTCVPDHFSLPFQIHAVPHVHDGAGRNLRPRRPLQRLHDCREGTFKTTMNRIQSGAAG